MKNLFNQSELYMICLAEKLSSEQEKSTGGSCSWSEFVDSNDNMEDALTKYNGLTDADKEKFDKKVKRVTEIVSAELDLVSGASQKKIFELADRIEALFDDENE